MATDAEKATTEDFSINLLVYTPTLNILNKSINRIQYQYILFTNMEQWSELKIKFCKTIEIQ